MSPKISRGSIRRDDGPCRKVATPLSVGIYQILQVVSVTVFERVPILQALQHEEPGENSSEFSNQLNLFHL